MKYTDAFTFSIPKKAQQTLEAVEVTAECVYGRQHFAIFGQVVRGNFVGIAVGGKKLAALLVMLDALETPALGAIEDRVTMLMQEENE